MITSEGLTTEEVMMFRIQHDELCIGALKVGMCDCDFIAKVRENQIQKDLKIVLSLPTKGDRDKWILKTRVINALWKQGIKSD